jgi:hypothetical protein
LLNVSILGGSLILKGQITVGCWETNNQRECVISQRKENFNSNASKPEYSQPLSYHGRTSSVCMHSNSNSRTTAYVAKEL